jgi:predicted transglutaminase-like cysteine proteinase
MGRRAVAWRVGLTVVLAAGLAGSAGALAQAAVQANPAPFVATAPMALGAPAPAPIGFLRFCARRPDQCGLHPAEAGAELETHLMAQYYWAVTFQTGAVSSEARVEARPPLAATDGALARLSDLNQRVNHAIRYESDIKQFGVSDYWTLPLVAGGRAAGDCKDYVLEKRRALTDAGVPLEDLSIAIVRTGLGETHAVLLVSTDQGELVLDSLSPRIMRWSDVRYTWIERQAPGRQLEWVKIPPRPLPRTLPAAGRTVGAPTETSAPGELFASDFDLSP